MMRLFLFCVMAVVSGIAAEFERINPEGERLYGEKSFAKAHEVYAAMEVGSLSAEEKQSLDGKIFSGFIRAVKPEIGV